MKLTYNLNSCDLIANNVNIVILCNIEIITTANCAFKKAFY